MGTPGKNSGLCFCLRYADARAAIDWLERAFGFRAQLVVDGGGPSEVAHAQLVLGRAMVMLGSVRNDRFGATQVAPKDAGGRVTASPYIIIDDVDAHHAKAAAAGAEIVSPPEDQDYGGRLYSCRDPEGHLWSFGSYDPWLK